MLRPLRLMLLSLLQTLHSRLVRGPLRPSWSFTMELIVRFMRRDWDETASWSFLRVREAIDTRPYPKPYLRKVTIRDEELAGMPARWFIPPGAPKDVALLYLHGGSYIYGSTRTSHADLIAHIALACGITAVGIDYRLAPEHPYPAQLEDALRAFDALISRGIERIIVAGDSAGGNLAVMLQIRLRDLGRDQGIATVLISPWADLTMPGRSFLENADFDFGTRDVLAVHARAFAGDIPLDDPRISPIRANLAGLAPTFVAVGSAEIPRDDIVAFANALEKAGVDVTLHVAKDMPHMPVVFADYHEEGRRCVEGLAGFVRRHARPAAEQNMTASVQPGPA